MGNRRPRWLEHTRPGGVCRLCCAWNVLEEKAPLIRQICGLKSLLRPNPAFTFADTNTLLPRTFAFEATATRALASFRVGSRVGTTLFWSPPGQI